MNIRSTKSSHENNFDFVRLVAALLVVWGHAYVLAGHDAPQLWNFGIHSIGLATFFAISGYLVTQSALSGSSVSTFLWRRALRILPALFVCVALCALVLGPLTSSLSFDAYFGHPQFHAYFLNMILYIKLRLPGVFTDNIVSTSVNGSLWSLPVEVLCYLSLAIISLISIKRISISIYLSTPLVILFGCAAMIDMVPKFLVYNMDIRQVAVIIPYFFVGASINRLGSRLPLRADVASFLIALMFLATGAFSDEMKTVCAWLFFPYIVLTIATRSTENISGWGGKFGDMSYGTYLYSMPVQQLLNHLFDGKAPIGVLLLGSITLSVLLGWLSWTLVERNALKLKDQWLGRPPTRRSYPTTTAH